MLVELELTYRCRAKPINYHVSLFDLQLGGSWEYKGLVKIDVKVTRPTKEIVLNSKEIDVELAETLGKDGLFPNEHTAFGLEQDWLTSRLSYYLRCPVGQSNRNHL